ncbi:protein phosphatase 2C domain-containing protein [Streptomyces sp. NPDC007088]|uniref:protein phosphatase 2C domain-containing protein n=1 Tax=Streptomyces sp. NPDC007088 TaxID=3364773 RepID=UPI0036CCC284
MDDITARPADRYEALARHEERLRRERRQATASAVRQAAFEARRPPAGRRNAALDALLPPAREPVAAQAGAGSRTGYAGATGGRPGAGGFDAFADSAIAVVHPAAGQEVDLDLRLGAPPAAVPAPARRPARPARPPLPTRGTLTDAAEDFEGALLPDTVLDAAESGALSVRAVSVRAERSRRRGLPRRDAVCLARYGSGLLLAVARGQGTAARAHLGAEQACRFALAHVVREAAAVSAALRAGDPHAFGAFADRAVTSVGALLEHSAHSAGRAPGEYATALRLLLVPLEPDGGRPGLVAVGEGGTARLREGVWDGRPGAGAGTGSLPYGRGGARPPVARLLEPLRPGDVLALGTEPLDGDRLTREYLATAWGEGPVPPPAELLRQVQHRLPATTADADRTAVVLWRRAGAGAGGEGL